MLFKTAYSIYYSVEKCAAKYKTDLVLFLKGDSLLDITPNMVTEYKGKMSLTLYQKVEDKNANAIHHLKVHIICLFLYIVKPFIWAKDIKLWCHT